jgi:universal stress protein E
MRLLTLRTVLVATDLEPSSDAALDSAYRLAASADATLHLIHAFPDPRDRDRSADAVRRVLRRASVSVDDARLHLIPGSPADAIRSLADRLAADVVVLGPHRTNAHGGDGPFGSTAQTVVARTFAPCLVAGRPLRLPLERVLAPIDLSETARGALLVALSWASALRAPGASGGRTTLSVLHVDSAAEGAAGTDAAAAVERELGTLERGAGDWAGVDVRATGARSTDVIETVTHYAADQGADLVVLGTRGLGMDDVVRLGSVSARLAARLSVPVLLVPPGVWRAYAAVP